MTALCRRCPGGVAIDVIAVPGARRDEIVGRHGDALRVRVTAAPEKGRANGAIEALLARSLGTRPSDVHVERGATSRRKRVVVTTDDPDAVVAAVAALSGE